MERGTMDGSATQDLLTPTEVASILRLSIRTATGGICRRCLPWIKVGGSLRMTRQSLDNYLRNKTDECFLEKREKVLGVRLRPAQRKAPGLGISDKTRSHGGARLREQLKSGKYIQEIPTFRELALKYLRKLNTYHTPHWASQVRWKINKYFPSLFDLAADQITADVLQEILSQLKDNKRARTLNELRKILKAVFNFGKKNELTTHNPADKLPVFPEDSAPRYIPSPANLRKVLQVASPEEKVHLLFLKNTMCRIGASLRVGWCDVNFVERWVTLRTRKTRGGGEKSWRVPINTELLRALRQLKKHAQSDFLFATIQGKIRQQYPRYLKKLCKRAKVKPFTFHSIRHYSATMA